MKVIDWEKKGNAVRFYLGRNSCAGWYGDDWNDRPYDCNAGRVYKKFICGWADICFPFGDGVFEPSDCGGETPFAKKDFMTGALPVIIDVPERTMAADRRFSWNDAAGAPAGVSFRIGDGDETLREYGESVHRGLPPDMR